MNHKGRLALLLAVVMCACVVAPVGGLAAESDGAQAGYYVYDNGGVPRTARAFLTGLDLEEGQTATLSRNGDEVDPDDPVATGDTLSIYDFQSVLAGEQILVVIGDVTGTGSAGMNQLVRLAAALYQDEPLEGAYALAADISGSGKLDLADLVGAAEQYRALEEGFVHDMSEVEVPWYIATPESMMPASLYVVDGERDIPYVALSDVCPLLAVLLGGDDESVIAVETDGDIIKWIRNNGSIAEMDFANGTVVFSNFNSFTSKPFASTSLDILSASGLNEEGEVRYFTRPDGSFERTGLPILLDLDAHGIDMIQDEEGEGYLPLQTFGDLFLAPMNLQVLYNGEAAFIVGGGSLGALSDLYYSAPTGERSEALAEFSYNELCLVLEMYYGLKEQHNIRSFDTLFQQTGLDKQLKSTDPLEADNALSTLCMGYLADLHSGFLSPSYLAGEDAVVTPSVKSPTLLQAGEDARLFEDARDAAYPDGMPGYEEVGNTAYVTFDGFALPAGVDYYTTPADENAEDTVGLIMYAHTQIMREDSPIENVVIDLSNNTGGRADAAVFVIGWFLGGKASINLNDTLTEAQATTVYGVDVNADGTVDATDSVASKKLYCLISPNSFSCGNLVPAAFKGSNKVTLLGRTSGGGACVVQPISLADGSIIQISGPLRLSSLSNGSYYDVDKGVEPDVPIVNVDNFYDREGLTEYINGLFR